MIRFILSLLMAHVVFSGDPTHILTATVKSTTVKTLIPDLSGHFYCFPYNTEESLRVTKIEIFSQAFECKASLLHVRVLDGFGNKSNDEKHNNLDGYLKPNGGLIRFSSRNI